MYDAADPDSTSRARAAFEDILAAAIALGGTITGEHGVGVEKINQMCDQFSSAELSQFHAIKAAFDPKGLLNPGKAVPLLKRCAEYGGLHVHGGELPFPELERF
jgi:glycolate oxidase